MALKNTGGLGVILVLAFFGAHSAYAQQQDAPVQDPNPAVEIRHKMMYFKMGLGQGFSGMSINQDGKKAELGFFGGNVDEYFGEFPEALDSAHSFRMQKIVGFTMWSVGLAALLIDMGYLAYIISANDQASFRDSQGLVWGLLAGGGVVGSVGGILLQNSVGTLSEAVNKFNGGLLNKYLPPDQKIDFRIFLGMNQQGVGLSYHF